MPHLSSLSMSITLLIFPGSNHEANDCEVKAPHKEEHGVWNDDAPDEAEADACAEDNEGEDETDSHGEFEIGKMHRSQSALILLVEPAWVPPFLPSFLFVVRYLGSPVAALVKVLDQKIDDHFFGAEFNMFSRKPSRIGGHRPEHRGCQRVP